MSNNTNQSTHPNDNKKQFSTAIYVILVVTLLLACVFLFFLFRGSKSATNQAQDIETAQIDNRFNASVPDATSNTQIQSKIEEYQQGEVREQQEAQRQHNATSISLSDIQSKRASLSDREAYDDNYDNSYDNFNAGNYNEDSNSVLREAKYMDKIEELEYLVSSLRDEIKDKETEVDNQKEIARRYEMASYQMASMNQQPVIDTLANTRLVKRADITEAKMIPINERVVSSFSNRAVNKTNSFSKNINSSEQKIDKNTLKVVVDKSVTVKDGEFVNLRLIERSRIGSYILPVNTILVAQGRIEGNRMKFRVHTIEYKDAIFSTNLTAFDLDGQEGIFIPGSDELNTLQEIGAGMIDDVSNGSAGVNFNNQSAKEQITVDATRGVMKGVSKLLQKKIRQVRIHLKSNHKLYLVSMKEVRESK